MDLQYYMKIRVRDECVNIENMSVILQHAIEGWVEQDKQNIEFCIVSPITLSSSIK